MNEARESIRNVVSAVMHGALNRPPILRIFTGSGKTTETLKEVARLAKLNHTKWIYVAPYHKTIEESLSFNDKGFQEIKIGNKTIRSKLFDFVHLEGRSRLCRRDKVKGWLEQGVDVSAVCNNCPYKKEHTCEYYRRMEQIYQHHPNVACVHAHLTTNLFSEFLPQHVDEYRTLILDEIPIQVLFNSATLTKKKCQDIISQVRKLRMARGEKRTILSIFHMISDGLRNPAINYEGLQAISTDDILKTREAYMKAIASTDPNKTEASLAKTVQVLLSSLTAYSSDLHRLEVAIYKATYYGVPKIFVNYFCHDLNINQRWNIICLDATATKEMWEFLLDRECDEIKITRPFENVYTIDHLAPLSQSFWLTKDSKMLSYSGKKYAAVIREIAIRSKKKVLVVSTKKIWTALCKYFVEQGWKEVDKLIQAKYYFQRSRNTWWEDCNTIVLLHVPKPPVGQVRCQAMLTNTSEQMWHEFNTTSEMKQALGRIRQALDTTKGGPRGDTEMYILPNAVPIEDRSGRVGSDEHPIFTSQEFRSMLQTRSIKIFKNPEHLIRYLKGEVHDIYDLLPANESELASIMHLSLRDVRGLLRTFRDCNMVEKRDGQWYRVAGLVEEDE